MAAAVVPIAKKKAVNLSFRSDHAELIQYKLPLNFSIFDETVKVYLNR